MRFSRRQRADPSINLTSLIDILFIVLLFLVLTTTFRGATVVEVDLPPAVTVNGSRMMRGLWPSGARSRLRSNRAFRHGRTRRDCRKR